jgi:hypothetical protein
MNLRRNDQGAIPEDSLNSKSPKVDAAGEMLRNISKLPVHPP